MKALAASSIGQYDKSVRALADYYRTVELGLGACFRESEPAALMVERKRQTDAGAIGAVVFGSDQGLVGQFNDVVADYAIKTLAALPGKASRSALPPLPEAAGLRLRTPKLRRCIGINFDEATLAADARCYFAGRLHWLKKTTQHPAASFQMHCVRPTSR